MTQYDIDINTELKELFQVVRGIILSYPYIREIRNAKQTSYRDEYSTVVMMRVRGDVLVLAFAKGFKLQEKYSMLEGSGKIVRHLYLRSMAELDEKLLCEMIEESLVLNMEAYELRAISSMHRNEKKNRDIEDEM